MWTNPQETADLVTFTEEILNEKLHFLGSVTLVFFTQSQMDKAHFITNFSASDKTYNSKFFFGG